MRRCLGSRILMLLVALAPASHAQSPVSKPWEPGARSIGLCQCLADHNSRKLPCVAGIAQCRADCGSALFAFLPLTRDALATCPAKELYVVFPNADGSAGSGAINVNSGGTSTLLDQPYAAAQSRDGKPAAVEIPPRELESVFARAVGARPILPRRYRLYFPIGGSRPLPDSTAVMREIVADIRQRPVSEVEVIGYTDTLAAEAANQNLSLERAAAIRQALMREGVDPRTMTTGGRGEHDLAVPTPLNVPEQRNRRVEVTVR